MEEGGGTKNKEGFTRLVVQLPDSEESMGRIKGVGADSICKVGTIGEATLVEWEGTEIVEVDW